MSSHTPHGKARGGSTPTDRLVVLAATFREADTHHRESLAARLQELGASMPERVLLHTCHRVELVAVAPPGWAPPAWEGMRVHRGTAAVERTLLVAGGLDSAVMAEEQLLGQVREAYGSALARGEGGPVLNELFRRAIRFGKRVRTEAQPATDRSLADRAVRWVTEQLRPGQASALVIGTGTMGIQLARRLAESGLTVTVASRSPERADLVVAQLPDATRHRISNVEGALADAARYDVLAVAVRSGATPVERRHLASTRLPPLVIDLSAPRAVSDEAAGLLGDRLLDLDRLGRDDSSARLTTRAQRRLRTAAAQERDRFVAWLETRGSGDGIRLLRGHAAEIRRRHLDRLGRSGRLDADQMAAVEAATAAMLGELLHAPTLRLRADADAAAVVRRVFDIDP